MNEQEKASLIAYRMKRAKSTLREVDLHIGNELWNTAINRLYYACYYAVIALLLKNNILAQTHTGVRQMFGLHFIKPGLISKESGQFFTEIFDKRLTGDYDDFVENNWENVVVLVEPAAKLIEEIESLISE